MMDGKGGGGEYVYHELCVPYHSPTCCKDTFKIQKKISLHVINEAVFSLY